MAYVVASRVGETSASTGSGDIVLDAALDGHVRVSARMSVGDIGEFVVAADDNSAWWRGVMTYSALDTLTRTTLIESSTGGAVNFPAGGIKVFMVGPDAARAIDTATSKATPVDADALGIVDSAASNVLKKLTWANLKATLKTYFDTLYATIASVAAKQDALVSGTNIKTINGSSVLGSGDLTVGGSRVYLSTVTASGSATVDVEATFDGTYDAYVLEAVGVVPSVNGVQLYCRMKLGGAYDTGANYYYTVETTGSTTADSTYVSSNWSTGIDHLLITSYIGNTAGYLGNFEMKIANPASTSLRKLVTFSGASQVADKQIRKMNGVGGNTAVTALTGLRFYCDTGNITSGTFRLYGIKNS